MKRILIIILCFTNFMSFSQSILVNNQSVNVSSDISFPYWLDSTSTLAIDSNVVSISVLEFNITPTTNGNSLVFNQAKTVTSQETVPSGKTWKVESVLLDPSFVSTSNNNGTTTVVSGGGGSLRPVALSSESSNQMYFGEAMFYCNSLVEDGYDNWVIPTLNDIEFIVSGGGDYDSINSGIIWTSTYAGYAGGGPVEKLCINLSIAQAPIYKHDSGNQNKNRCVRHAAVTVSSGGGNSSSGGSGNVVSSSLTPIAISAESPNFMFFDQAMSYCDSLLEDGNDDWVLPSIDDLTYAGSGGLVLPDSKTSNYLWSVTPYNNGAGVFTLTFINDLSSSIYLDALVSSNTDYNSNSTNKTRCIRRGAITVSDSGGGSSSGGSIPSTLGNGMPTMISNESTNKMIFGNCVLYCDSLSENGHSDWILPTIDQLTYATSGGCIIPDTRSSDYIWTRSFDDDEDAIIYKLIPPDLNDGYNQTYSRRTDNAGAFGTYFLDPKCRCVR